MVGETNRRRVLGGIGAAGTISLAGCLDALEAGDEDGNGDEDVDAMVGILQPESGDLGDLGTPIADAAELPAIQLEDEGADVEIDVRREDTETTPDVGVSRAEALLDAGYPAVTGAAASDVTITCAEDVWYDNEVVAISPASTSPDITDMPGDYLLRTAPSDEWQGDAMAEIAVDQEGADSIATMYLNNDYGQGLNDVFVAGCEDRGADVLEEVPFEPEQPSYDSELESTVGEGPDLLMVVGYPESGQVIFRDFYDDFDDGTTILVPDGLIDQSLPGQVDNPMENVMGTAPGAGGDGAEFFADLYEDEYGSAPSVFNAQAYDATAVLILATLAAGEIDGAAIAEHVREVANPDGEEITPETLGEGVELAADGEAIEYRGASGPVEFDDAGDQVAVTYEIGRYHEDGYDVEDTVEYEA
ncbi:ABC transporter substrate-binding protein [Natronococcus occultus]|uniref:Amino acid/amide ABC transporter substrate-binding protein, HAAT family n=1 Tax=Natronococcus occultus SP4 TaxID=694430 RepID=L0JY86_9EURY|nr:ABC transporter substrate-binding protein [Natronococcus occultus]AGB37265.1 amino acid/amide ABC transporter substrate-binding protein, HAAT family [Natronococcus occultus SP4]